MTGTAELLEAHMPPPTSWRIPGGGIWWIPAFSPMTLSFTPNIWVKQSCGWRGWCMMNDCAANAFSTLCLTHENQDGNGPKKSALLVKVIVKSGPGNFYGLAIHADFIYWSDWTRRSVLRSNKYTGSDTKVLRADIPHQPMGIIAVARDTNNCKYLTKPKPVDVMSGNICSVGPVFLRYRQVFVRAFELWTVDQMECVAIWSLLLPNTRQRNPSVTYRHALPETSNVTAAPAQPYLEQKITRLQNLQHTFAVSRHLCYPWFN